MGGICSGGTGKNNTTVGEIAWGVSRKIKQKRNTGKLDEDSYSASDSDGSPRSPLTPSKKGNSKVIAKTAITGRTSIAGLERAVEVLGTIGNSMSYLNTNNRFLSGMAFSGSRISILAFEVANTITKGASLSQSLAEENIQFLKKETLQLDAVQLLVSSDMEELMSIAAADKRQEFDVFSKEVVRFGNLCKNPQWHNLGRYFSRLDSEELSQKQLRAEAETTQHELNTLAQHTSELYHELNALDRFEQDYRRKLQEVESSNPSGRGEILTNFERELTLQRKLVRSLQKKSLWSRNLEEIVKKLVDIVTYIHQAILEAFGNNGSSVGKKTANSPQRLGVAGLALHYANIINQINSIASRPTSLPYNIRDALYRGLPMSVKTALRPQLRDIDAQEEQLSVSQVKAEMDKIFQWLVPVATNTCKAHQAFGWVGEWANSSNESNKSATTNINTIRLQTLYHADKQKTEVYILELVAWLHCLISLVRQRNHRFKPLGARSPTPKELASPGNKRQPTSTFQSGRIHKVQLHLETKKWSPEISKDQESPVEKKKDIRFRVWSLSSSALSSPNREFFAGENYERR